MAKIKKAVKTFRKAVSKKSGAKQKPRPKTARQPGGGKKRGAVKKAAARGRARFQAPPAVEIRNVTVGRGNKHFSVEAKREFRDKLLRLRERITGQINFLVTDNLSRTQKDAVSDFRSEEQGTDNFDRDFALNRVSSEQDIVLEIDEALNRIKAGSYGLCEICRGQIEKARLNAVPYSRMCVGCQSKLETGRKKFRSFETAALFPNADKTAPEAAVEEE